MTKKLLIAVSLLLVAVAVGFYFWWTKPYKLPEITPGITIEQYGLDFSEEMRTYPAVSTISDSIADLQQAVAKAPDNLAYSNALRTAMARADQAEAFIAFANEMGSETQRLKLQKALAYIDQLQNPDLGTASLGQISSRSISILNEIISENPYDWLAHYARGLNNLYWPSGLQRTDKAIQDLAYCLAVAKQLMPQMDSPLWPMIYTAYGDALVKAGKSQEGIAVWKEGAKRFPEDKPLADRKSLNSEEARERVKETRGIDTFQRPDPSISDLSVLWDTK
ncbi:tetratricopeptide repeat protein [Cohnella soli]|uniref:Tetratricopeptide repeat protein n=1 Tax=Cohnella soli TaxID=425005 RepID=A0ABW0I1W7_9BACL